MIVEEEKNDASLERIDVELSPTSVLHLGEYALRSLAAVGVFPFFSSSDANLFKASIKCCSLPLQCAVISFSTSSAFIV